MLWFYALPVWAVELVAMACAAGLAVGGHALVQRRIPYARLAKHNDVAGFLFSVVGVLYAIVLGFVVVVVWQKYDASVATALSEESALSDMYRLAAAYPPPVERRIRGEIREYAVQMIRREWPAMAAGSSSEEVQRLGERVAKDVERLRPTSAGETNVHAAMLTLLERFLDGRRERLRSNDGSVLGILWFTLFGGACAMIGFAYLFGTENRRMQLLMTAIVAALLTAILVLIAEFDRPFSGSISVSDQIWRTFIDLRMPEIR